MPNFATLSVYACANELFDCLIIRPQHIAIIFKQKLNKSDKNKI